MVRAAGERIEVSPELRRELRHPDVELVDELVADPAKAALRRARPERRLLEDHDVRLAPLAEEERRRNPDDPTTDDERRRAVRDAQSASSVNAYFPSMLVTVPKRGLSWVKPTIHRSSAARARIVRFASSVSSGKRSCAGIHGSGRWWRSGMKSDEKKTVRFPSVTRTVWGPRV